MYFIFDITLIRIYFVLYNLFKFAKKTYNLIKVVARSIFPSPPPSLFLFLILLILTNISFRILKTQDVMNELNSELP